jgi:RNA polymerase sigma factor (sigma-70 family)
VTETLVVDLVVLPPIAADPVFGIPSSPDPVERVADGPRGPLGSDPHDFAGLFIKHKWSFQLHARRFLSDQRDIDEVVQEAYLKLFLALPELETELQALAYARRTITNLCIDRYRADQRRPRLVDLESLPVSVLFDEDVTDPIVQAEDAAIVREALAMLSPLHRAALIKREIEEKSLPQIAAELDIPVEQVKHVLHRARRALRRLLVGTHVEPGVDLDLAMVLEANRARAAQIAKPAGVAMLAMLLMLAGVVGLRPDNRARAKVDVAPLGTVEGLVGRPIAPVQTGPASQPPVAVVPTLVKPQVPARPTTHAAAPTHRARLQARPVPAPLKSTAPVTPSAVPVTPPSQVQPTTPTTVDQPSAYVVSGVNASGPAQVADMQRDLRAGGTTSSSTLTAQTPFGAYALRQAYTFASDGTLSGVVLNEAVPLPEGNVVGTLVQGTATSAHTLANGSVRLTTKGTATPLAAFQGQPVPTRALTVELVLAPDRVSVVSETVSVVPQALVSEVGPTPSPLVVVPSAAPSGPSAPQPSAGQDPVLFLRAQDPAGPSEAVVVVQDRATH